MNYLITGGTGFIGSSIARQLLDSGHRVVLCDISPDGDVVSTLKSKAAGAKLRIVQGDVSKKGVVNRLLEAQKFDAIIHMAGLLSEECARDSSRAIETNCLGTVHVLEGAVRYDIPRVIWGSSIAAGQATDETMESLPSWASLYVATMTFDEHLARVYHDKFGLTVIALRLPYVYGIGRVRGPSFGQAMITRALDGKSVRVPFGDEVLNWVYIEDAVRAVLSALKVSRPRKLTYTISGEVRSLKDVAHHLEKTCPYAHILLEPGRTGLTWQFDSSDAERDLNYKPAFSVEDGINAMRRELKSNPPLSAGRVVAAKRRVYRRRRKVQPVPATRRILSAGD